MASKSELQTSRYLHLIFAILPTGIGIAGHLYYEDQKRAVRQERHEDLQDTADLKVNLISW